MASTVAGLFSDYRDAEAAAAELERQGFDRAGISVFASGRSRERTGMAQGKESLDSGATAGAAVGGAAGIALSLVALAIPGAGPVLALGPLLTALTGAGVGAVAGGVIGAMSNVGIPREHAEYYSKRVEGGGTLVMVHCAEGQAERAAAILDGAGAENVDMERDRGPQPVPVVHEDISLGTPEGSVRSRAARIYSGGRYQERAATDTLGPFEEGTIEVRETAERPVIRKHARVKEEVVVSKEHTERTGQVRSRVRQTEVDVEPVNAQDQKHNHQASR